MPRHAKITGHRSSNFSLFSRNFTVSFNPLAACCSIKHYIDFQRFYYEFQFGSYMYTLLLLYKHYSILQPSSRLLQQCHTRRTFRKVDTKNATIIINKLNRRKTFQLIRIEGEQKVEDKQWTKYGVLCMTVHKSTKGSCHSPTEQDAHSQTNGRCVNNNLSLSWRCLLSYSSSTINWIDPFG